VTTNVTSGFFSLYSFIVSHLHDHGNTNKSVPLLGGKYWTEIFIWIPKYIFDKDIEFTKENDHSILKEIHKGRNFIFLVDRYVANGIKKGDKQLVGLDRNTDPIITINDKTSNQYNRSIYPYNNLDSNLDIGRILVKANFK
jgi:hypothetical protein